MPQRGGAAAAAAEAGGGVVQVEPAGEELTGSVILSALSEPTSAANGNEVCVNALEMRVECDAPNAPNMRGRRC